ncbi:MAG: magnesium transporter, partial [Proteobacteria bacterium]|nr:magnesium transporter [Pseudomonadota bacterium]
MNEEDRENIDTQTEPASILGPVDSIDELDPVSRAFELWSSLSQEERLIHFKNLDRSDAEELFLSLGAREQGQLIILLPSKERRSWIRLLAPDDAADLLQEIEVENREDLITHLDKVTRQEVSALLAYSEDEAGGLMSPRYARLRPDMTVDEAITYIRRQARRPIETITYFYVLNSKQVLLGVVALRELFLEQGSKLISDIMLTDIIAVYEDTNQEEVSKLFKQHNLVAIPVVDQEDRLKGIITVDDVMQAIEEEVTEDMQKIGGTEAFDEPYMEIGLTQMIKKRGGWLSILFIGEMFTASAMSHYEHEISKAVVLALFIPLVISSGGNAGSQASTLVIRALALGEVKAHLWFKVLLRELCFGLVLGFILGIIGFVRICIWQSATGIYGDHFILLGLALWFSLIGIVLWGAVAGSMLPLLLKKLGLDPASASAPFVATLVDVTGLVIYFN